MSIVYCPSCDNEIETEIVSALHEGDEAVDRLFQGTLNVVFCDACASDFHCDEPLVYRSEDSSAVVFYNPQLAGQPWEKCEELMQQVEQASIADLPAEKPPDFRITTNRNDFVEKISLLMNELDDRIVEYIKYQIFASGEAEFSGERLYYDFNASNESVEFFSLSRKDGRPGRSVGVGRDVYQDLVDADGSERLNLEEIFPGSYVQVDRLIQQ